MPIWTYPDLATAPPPAPAATPDASLRTALTLVQMDEATRRGIRISPRGVSFYRTIAEGEAARESYAIACLRAASSDPGSRGDGDE